MEAEPQPQHQPQPQPHDQQQQEGEEKPKEEKEPERGTNLQTTQHILQHHEEEANEEQTQHQDQEDEGKDKHIISTPSSPSSSSSSHIELDLTHEKAPETSLPNDQTNSSPPPPPLRQQQRRQQQQQQQPAHDQENHIIESSTPSSPSSDESPASRLSSRKAEESAATPLHVPTPPPSTARRSVRDPQPVVTKVESGIGDGFVGNFHVTSGDGGGVGSGGGTVGVSGRRLRQNLSILKRTRRESMVRRALLVFRFCGFVFCLVSFSVLAADRNKGWALDSFYRYKEFRFSLAVNVIGFVYSGLQACDLSYNSATGKHLAQHHLRHYLNFVLDQILSYLLISSASSAATRVEDWETNWGQDKFPQMATVSVGVSILAFLAFALCSIVSGYALCTRGYN